MLNYIFQYKFTILLTLVIALLSLLPDSSMPESSLFSIPYFDKLVHFSMYTTIGFVALLESRCNGHCRMFHFLLLLGILMLSALIEVFQATLVATRSAEWLDLAANAFGLVSGYIVYRLYWLIRS
jgi:VanZ family protein